MRPLSIVLVVLLTIACGKFNKLTRTIYQPGNVLPGDGHGHERGTGSDDDSGGDGGGSGDKEGGGPGGGTGITPVEFVVGFGVGYGMNNPYNTKDTPIVVKRGGLIRFVNKSGRSLTIHCDGGFPMSHWGSTTHPVLADGASRNYRVENTMAYDPQTDSTNRCYNHDEQSNGGRSNNPLFIKLVD